MPIDIVRVSRLVEGDEPHEEVAAAAAADAETALDEREAELRDGGAVKGKRGPARVIGEPRWDTVEQDGAPRLRCTVQAHLDY